MTPDHADHWMAKGVLAASTLDFRRRAAEALDKNLVGLIRSGGELGTVSFQTEGKRPCAVVIAVGEKATKVLTLFMEQYHKQFGVDTTQ